MALIDKLSDDIKTAMKARDRDRLTTLRLLLAELKKVSLDKGIELDQAGEVEVLARAAKQRREAITAFRDGGRDEMADKEASELKIIEEYLPKQLSRAEVEAMAKEVIAEVGATTKKEMGKVMGKLMPKLKGKFPGKDVGPIVSGLLG